MKKIILITIFFIIAFAANVPACIAPLRPMLPIKPIWCQGIWTQQLQCDSICNCIWVPVCIQQ